MEPLCPKLEYELVEELKDAPESVKRIFSVEYGERSDYTGACKKDLVDLVKKHKYDKNSLQMKSRFMHIFSLFNLLSVAYTTACIRHWTAWVDEILTRKPKKPAFFVVKIDQALGYRRRLLRWLREEDYGAFVKILDDLKISYQIPKQPEHVKTRKAWSEHVLKQRVEAEKERRMEELRAKLEKDSEARLKDLNAQLEALSIQKADIKKQLEEFKRIENRIPLDVKGKYEQKLVEEFYESSIHANLFHPPPSAKAKV
jgi:small subunit ribosomal protein S15